MTNIYDNTLTQTGSYGQEIVESDSYKTVAAIKWNGDRDEQSAYGRLFVEALEMYRLLRRLKATMRGSGISLLDLDREAGDILDRIDGNDPVLPDAEARLIDLAKDVHAALTNPLRGLSMPADEFALRLKNTLFDLGEEID